MEMSETKSKYISVRSKAYSFLVSKKKRCS